MTDPQPDPQTGPALQRGNVPSAPIERAISAVDKSATLVFAVEGGATAAVAGLDLFGVVIVGLIASCAGGVTRDVLLGDAPPRALRSVTYLLLGLGGGLAAFVLHGWLDGTAAGVINVLDAIGLALFAVSGASIAMMARTNAVTAILLGTLTAVGGGVARDVLLDRTPSILSTNVYALAAAAGAAALVWAWKAGLTRYQAMALGGGVCLTLRLLAIAFDWQLPIAG